MPGLSARRCAQALFELASENEKEETWLIDLREIEEIFSDPLVDLYLSVPQVAMDSKLSITADLLSEYDDLLKNTVNLIISRGSIDVLPKVVAEYSTLVDNSLGRTKIEVTSAVSLSKDQEVKLSSLLKSLIDTEVLLSLKVMPEILGGMLVQIGDRIIDGSVSTRLELLRQELKRGSLVSEVS